MRFGALVLAAVLLAGQAKAADQAQQFDLVCKGELKISSQSKPEPVEHRYRVDLATGLWCEDQCSDVRRLQDATASRITFEQHGEALREGSVLHIVERTTGQWYESLGGSVYLVVTGQCEPAPFSGINPQTKF